MGVHVASEITIHTWWYFASLAAMLISGLMIGILLPRAVNKFRADDEH